jgi:hypothetical protein
LFFGDISGKELNQIAAGKKGKYGAQNYKTSKYFSATETNHRRLKKIDH